MKIRQEFVAEKLRLWRLGRNEKVRAEILTEISPYISHYPGFVWRCNDDDTKSDFYLYVLERIDQILSHYDENKCRFVTYLSVCLRHAWWRLRRSGRQVPSESLDVLAENGFEPPAPGVEMPDHVFEGQFLGALPPVARMVLRLHEPETLEGEDLQTLMAVTGKPLGDCALFVEDLLHHIRQKRQHQTRLENLLTGTHHALTLSDAQNPETERNLMKKQENALSRYRRVRVRPPARLLSEFLGWKTDQIYQVLRDARRQWKEKAA